MEDMYGLTRQRSGVWRSLREGDFEEEDVWSVFKEKSSTTTTTIDYPPNGSSSSSSSRTMAHPMVSKAKGSRGRGGEASKIVHPSSAPVNIPNWPKVVTNTNGKASWYDQDEEEEDDDGDRDGHGHGHDDDEEEYDMNGDFGYKLPPHEFIARRLAKSQISSFSVFEGVGRTLKGRDLSKVRNAVLTKTGFLESF